MNSRSGAQPTQPATRRRRWPYAIGSLLLTAIVAVGASVVFWNHADETTGTRVDWHSPAQTRLASPMQVQPVAGWKAIITAAGVSSAPEAPAFGKIATDEDPAESSPFIGNLGETAYFIVTTPAAGWRLVAVDSRVGSQVFPPVPLSDAIRPPRCFLNGPDYLLCLGEDETSTTALVIDARTGALIYSGPSDLRTAPAVLVVRQVGIYAVAETQNQGVYGVGPKAETTWFVPGDGSVEQKYVGARDMTPPSLATETAHGSGSPGTVVFSLADGQVVEPKTEGNAQQQQTVVYPRGFASEFEVGEGRREIRFFDDAGKRVGDDGVRGLLVSTSLDLPMVQLTSGGWTVYTADGGELLHQEGDTPEDARLIGDTFFVKRSGDDTIRRWQAYDLRTGAPGRECSFNLGSGYLGTDGTVGVFESGNPNIGLVTKGVDLGTCDTLWQIQSPVGSFRDVWRVGTTLVQLSDDGTELTSLVAPRS